MKFDLRNRNLTREQAVAIFAFFMLLILFLFGIQEQDEYYPPVGGSGTSSQSQSKKGIIEDLLAINQKPIIWKMASVPTLSWTRGYAMPFCPYCLTMQNYNPYNPSLRPSVCHQCQKGYSWVSAKCPECKGAGRSNGGKCASCGGDGIVGN